MMANLFAAWIGFLLGTVAGAVSGLFFHRADWLGGYASWPRRMTRLGHVAFFGIGLLNLGFVLTARTMGITTGLAVPSALLLVTAVTMPLLCYLSAWRPAFRHLFFVPVVSLAAAVVIFLGRLAGS